jgi:hypothetical protein
MDHPPEQPTSSPSPVAAGTPQTVKYTVPGDSLSISTVLPQTSAGPTPLVDERTIGQYELLGEIGRGGMGIVYRAREPHSGRLVALKMMHGASADASADLQRFILEARATSQLNHPGIIAIHAWGEHRGHPFYTMDFVPGPPLSRVLESGALSCERAVKYMGGIARAVAAAHALGIVHRDLKPGNIIIDAGDQPRILDFGLAKLHAPRLPDQSLKDEPQEVLPIVEPALNATSDFDAAKPLTEKGAILGTPSYMAPEQVRAEHDQVGPPADVHALGAIFHEMLTGKPPYTADSNYGILMQVLRDKPPPIRTFNPRVPVALEALCRYCLAKTAEDRYADAGALADDLDKRWHRFLQTKMYARLTLMAALLVLLLGAVQVFLAAVPGLAPSRIVEILADRATGSVPLKQTAEVLAGLTQALVLTLVPLAAGVAGFIWLGAWLWHTYSPTRLALAWVGGAILCLVLWLIADYPWLNFGQSTFVWLAAATPAVVLTALFLRFTVGRKRTTFTSAHQSEPYLQKLLGARADLQSRSADVEDEKPSSLADFELGKEVHSWNEGRVNWGRQPSLDRAVLIWVHANEPSTMTGQTGVVVRHPFVLNLHAVGQGEEGRFLVTEAIAATPLAIMLQRGPLAPLEAVTLTIRLAHAIQAFHDQGACHGRIQPDWFMVRGELEPVVCPCGIPSSSSQEQVEDVQALGRLLRDWLPSRARGWWLDPQASLYRVCDAACSGVYARARDLAIDLERSLQLVRLRRRVRWANAVALALLIIPLLVVAVMWLNQRANPAGTEVAVAVNSANRAIAVLVAICSSTLVVGCTQVRFWIRRKRLHLSRTARGRIGIGGTIGSMVPLAVSAVLALALGLFGVSEVHGVAGVTGTIGLILAEMAGFWALGGLVAGLASGLDLLLHSLPGSSRLRHESDGMPSGTSAV